MLIKFKFILLYQNEICRFSSFSIVDWFCLFVDLWVLPFPLEDLWVLPFPLED